MINQPNHPCYFDPYLLFAIIALVTTGLVMVASASAPIAQTLHVPVYHHLFHHFLYVTFGIFAFLLMTFMPIDMIKRYHGHLLLFSLALLIVLLIPGVTRPVNGSIRWFFIGPFSFQPSELAKLTLIFYMSSYMIRRESTFKNQLKGFVIPMVVLGIFTAFLLLEPDFGTAVVIILTVLGMMFIGGVPYRRFLGLIPMVASVFCVLTLTSSYRLQRFVSFRDPWADQYNHGYQLVQSLIAFGQGGWFGKGLGASVQKLNYLPEAHTDFIYAILAEELGLFGAMIVIALFMLFIFRGMLIGRRAQIAKQDFAAYIVYGIVLWIGFQAMINIGVNIGSLPTKGITLPLVSSGGSSLLLAAIGLGIVFRVDFEARLALKK